MSALLTTLPGDIPGLLRRGSPVVWSGVPATVHLIGLQVLCLAWEDGGSSYAEDDIAPAECALDLTDPTGCAHAAWWIKAERVGKTHLMADLLGSGWWTVTDRAMERDDMLPKQIDTLARLVLRLAGRTP